MEVNYLPLNEIEHDKLYFKDKALEISKFVTNFRSDVPYAVSINGAWGSGKDEEYELVD